MTREWLESWLDSRTTSSAVVLRGRKTAHKRAHIIAIATLIVSVIGATAALAQQDGLIDQNFGIRGVFTSFDTRPSGVDAVAVQPDGRIVAAGFANDADGSRHAALARYRADGSLDATCGRDGRVTTAFGGFDERAHAIVLQPDGKIVVAGSTMSGWTVGTLDIAVARYNADGSLDRTFGRDGTIVTDVADTDAGAAVVGLQPDGRIVVAGVSTSEYVTDDGAQFVLVRYNGDGSLDRTFGDGGQIRAFPHRSGLFAYGFEIQADGRILAAAFDLQTKRLHMMRVRRDGTRDDTFNRGRITDLEMPTETTSIADIAVQPDGRIVIAGSGRFRFAMDRSGLVPSDSNDILLMRLEADGTPDRRFGRDGLMVTDIGFAGTGPTADRPLTLAIQPDGRILVAGTASETPGEAPVAVLARYTADGDRDPSLGGDGIVFVSLTGVRDSPALVLPRAFALQSDGKIILAGEGWESQVNATWAETTRHFVLVRFQGTAR